MKISFVLSGGGARGIAHLGFIEAMNEIGVKPDLISGTSAGAIIGAFIANGYSPQETLSIIQKSKIFDFVSFTLGKGLLSMRNANKAYHKYLNISKFEDLPLELKIIATNIETGAEKCFHEKGSIIEPVIASSSIPTLFEPMVIDGVHYVDGGVVNNFPVEYARYSSDIVFGQYVNPWVKKNNINSYRELIERTFHLAIYSGNKQRMMLCDVVTEPPALKKYSIFDLKNSDAIYQIGYRAVMDKRKEVEKILNEF